MHLIVVLKLVTCIYVSTYTDTAIIPTYIHTCSRFTLGINFSSAAFASGVKFIPSFPLNSIKFWVRRLFQC